MYYYAASTSEIRAPVTEQEFWFYIRLQNCRKNTLAVNIKYILGNNKN